VTLATCLPLPERFYNPRAFVLASFGILHAPTLVVTDITRVADDPRHSGPAAWS
jgi:hypothetical protein